MVPKGQLLTIRLVVVASCAVIFSDFGEATEPKESREDWAICYPQWLDNKNLLSEDALNDALVACINSSFSAKATVSHRWSILMALGQLHAAEKEFPVAIKFYETVLSQKVNTKYELRSRDFTENIERELMYWNQSRNRPCSAAKILADLTEKIARENNYSSDFNGQFLDALTRCRAYENDYYVEGFGQTKDKNYLPIVRISPRFPKKFLKKKVDGYVIVEVTVTRLGTVENARTIESDLPEDFHKEAMKAAEKFKYRPRLLRGETVDTDGVRIRFDFKQGR